MKLTRSMIRKAVKKLKKYQIPPELCGCVKMNKNVTLTCEEHTKPLTAEQIRRANKNLKAMGLKPVNVKKFLEQQKKELERT